MEQKLSRFIDKNAQIIRQRWARIATDLESLVEGGTIKKWMSLKSVLEILKDGPSEEDLKL